MYKRRARPNKKRVVRKRRGAKRGRRFSRKARSAKPMKSLVEKRSTLVPLQYPFSYTMIIGETGSNVPMYSGSSYPNCFGMYNGPSTGDPAGHADYVMPVGLSQYGAFYSKFRVHASTINLQVTNLSENKIHIGLLAVPYDSSLASSVATLAGENALQSVGFGGWQSPQDSSKAPGSITLYGALQQYANAKYVDLMNEPFFKWRLLNEATHTYCTTRFKSHRSTKKMCGVKILRDNDDFNNDNVANNRYINDLGSDSTPRVAPRGFVWILKTDAPDAEDTAILVQGKITYYVEFFERTVLRNPDWTYETPGMGNPNYITPVGGLTGLFGDTNSS